jgi:hypothetical protein
MYSTVQTSGDHVASHRPSVNRRVLGEIVDIDRLEKRLAQIAASPNEKAKQVNDCFRAGLDLSRFCAAPLITYRAAKEMSHEHRQDG